MEHELTGVVGSIVVALIHGNVFKDLKTKDELRKELSKTIKALAEDFKK